MLEFVAELLARTGLPNEALEPELTAGILVSANNFVDKRLNELG